MRLPEDMMVEWKGEVVNADCVKFGNDDYGEWYLARDDEQQERFAFKRDDAGALVPSGRAVFSRQELKDLEPMLRRMKPETMVTFMRDAILMKQTLGSAYVEGVRPTRKAKV